ncbi:ABC transporter permease [Paenibacillus sp. GXUN7292]|uniref:ABC transporter permease n=1 Tax=Paenibacillus sp. GXUN7292 TaxID=3422499 RepID=UPI003D7CD342
MLNFIKKDLLLFWRNRRETATVLLFPIILIVVLNFAFSGMIGSDSNPVALKLAIVNEDNEAEGIKQFEQHVLAMDMKSEAAQALAAQAAQSSPITLLYNYLQHEDLLQWLTVSELSEAEAIQQVKEAAIDGFIKIPQGYTYETLNAVLLDQGASVSLPFYVKEDTMNVFIIDNVINEYFDQINLQIALHKVAGEAVDSASAVGPLLEGGREIVGGSKPFTMLQYFTLAIGLLFPLFMASSVAEKTGAEKREQVFNRIMITNSRPLSFLMGKTFATFLLVFLQSLLVIIVSHLLMNVFDGKSIDFWMGLIMVLTVYAMCMAGLSALYTSIMLKLNSTDAANGLFMLITMVLGLIGGNFVPIYLYPQWVQQIGEWSPNGLTLAVLSKWIQFEELAAMKMPLLALVIFSAACIAAGVALYPKRGEG